MNCRSAPERRGDLVVVFSWSILSLYGWISNAIVIVSILTNTDLRKRSWYDLRKETLSADLVLVTGSFSRRVCAMSACWWPTSSSFFHYLHFMSDSTKFSEFLTFCFFLTFFQFWCELSRIFRLPSFLLRWFHADHCYWLEQVKKSV